MKVLITGDRNWFNIDRIRDILGRLPKDTTLIQGECRGADLLCKQIAKELFSIEPKGYPALWDKYGKRAGPIRNQQMIDEEHLENDPIDQCFAFHENIRNSRGTKDMCRKILAEQLKLTLITSREEIEIKSVEQLNKI